MQHEIAYFNKGNFRSFNINFMRYIKQLIDPNEETLNELCIDYTITSLIRNNQIQFLEDLKNVSNVYKKYDYNVYLFIVLLAMGQFDGISRTILNIKQNISDRTFELIDEEDFSFYISLSLLIDFDLSHLQELLVDNESFAYDMNDNHPNDFNILKQYSKAQFEDVIAYVDQIKDRLYSDPFLFRNADDIITKIKKNILKEILKSSSSVKLSYLNDLLKIGNQTKLEIWVFELIDKNKMNIIYDDIDKVIYMKKEDPLEEAVSNSILTSQKNEVNFLKKLLVPPKMQIREYKGNCEMLAVKQGKNDEMDFGD